MKDLYYGREKPIELLNFKTLNIKNNQLLIIQL